MIPIGDYSQEAEEPKTESFTCNQLQMIPRILLYTQQKTAMLILFCFCSQCSSAGHHSGSMDGKQFYSKSIGKGKSYKAYQKVRKRAKQ